MLRDVNQGRPKAALNTSEIAAIPVLLEVALHEGNVALWLEAGVVGALEDSLVLG
jgi:hypothetical protein